MKHISYLALLVMMTCGFCSPNDDLDLRQTQSDSLKNIPIGNQDNYGVCYAYSASTLIDFYRNTLKSDQYANSNTNPVYAAQRSALFTGAGNIEGGEICDVVNALSKEGQACSNYSVTGDQIRGLGLLAHAELVNSVYMPYLLHPETFQRVDPIFYPSNKRKHLTKVQKNYLEKVDAYLTWIKVELNRRRILNTNIPSDEAIFSFIQKTYIGHDFTAFSTKLENWLTALDCTQFFKMPRLSCNHYSGKTLTTDPISLLDQTLFKQNPVGIDFCSKVLTDHDYNASQLGADYRKNCGFHAAVVIGKKYVSGAGKCYYLIRNSWGKDYPSYAWDTSSGDIWVEENSLAANLYGLSIVKP